MFPAFLYSISVSLTFIKRVKHENIFHFLFFSGSLPGGFGFGNVSLTFTEEELETHDIVYEIADYIQNSEGFKEGRWTIVATNEVPTPTDTKRCIEDID